MSKERIILEKIEALKKDIEILTNPLFNDSEGSILWKDVYDNIDKAHKILIKDKRIYGW